MRTLIGLVTCMLLVVSGGTAFADEPAKLEGRVTDLLGKPVEGARVHIVSRAGVEQTVTTDKDGRYRVALQDSGAYSVVFASGKKQVGKQLSVELGVVAVLDAELEQSAGEVIDIHDFVPPPVLPKPRKDPSLTAPYSSEAILSDAWGKAWLLLDVDKAGTVTRLKVLKKAGHDLDAIAVREGLKLRFDPARDAAGNPVGTLIIWGMEWPSYGWLIAREGTAARVPPYVNWEPFHASLVNVPCEGSGPLQLESIHPVYRDCSRPDLKQAAKVQWLTKP